jgi:hypothetical protein
MCFLTWSWFTRVSGPPTKPISVPKLGKRLQRLALRLVTVDQGLDLRIRCAEVARKLALIARLPSAR